MATDFQRTAFRAILRTAREQAGLTQRDLAAAVGVSPSAVAQWEGGTAAPREDLAAAAEHALNLAPGTFGMVLGFAPRDLTLAGVVTHAELVEADPYLTPSQRRLLHLVYDEMTRDTRAAIQRAEDSALHGDPTEEDPEGALDAQQRDQEQAEQQALDDLGARPDR